LQDLMKQIRQAIKDESLLAFREEFFARYGYDNEKESPVSC
jgi:queuine/archaeosine tRNA-ribosyltransferase